MKVMNFERFWVNVTVLIYFCSSLYFFYVLLHALSEKSLYEAWFVVVSSKWAFSALIDYIAGVSFTSIYILLRAETFLSGITWSITAAFLGNPVLLLFVSLNILQHGSVTKGILLSSSDSSLETSNESHESVVSKQLYKVSLFVMFCVFIAVCIDAILSDESFQTGVEYVNSNLWAKTTFIDNLLGLLFTAVFIAVHEHFEWTRILVLWTALALCGNGITLLYVMYKISSCNDPFSLHSALLTTS
mmetsp:Transcript_10475/g.18887  ORF Transcript_10475/g.18887 Transcript_10475/m.18887 type:complete len:245 (-) Transcript_10475:588-1322(-)